MSKNIYLTSLSSHENLTVFFPTEGGGGRVEVAGGSSPVANTGLRPLCPGLFGRIKTRRGSPFDRRPSTAEAPPIGKIHPFSKMAVTFEPVMRF